MFHVLKSKLRFAKFNYEVRALKNTRPIVCDPESDVVCVSHVGKRYLYAYLLSVKTLSRFIPLKKIIVIDDLSLSDLDKNFLREHVVGIDIRAINSVPNSKCPSSGDWEGFLVIGEEAKDHFCIMLDADIVTVAELPEVAKAIKENRSFTLGTWRNQRIVPIREACENVISSTSKHIQILSEQNLVRIPEADRFKYVRGCGAFAGFPKGKGFRPEIEEFSGVMESLIGREKWVEWGSQQVASNYFVANSPDAVVLPFPKYASFGPGIDTRECSFIHFIGSHRFDDGVYARVAKQEINSL